MPTPTIQKDTPKIWDIWFYTWRNEIVQNRWDYMDRDIVPSRILVTKIKQYNKLRPTLPDQRIEIRSFSYPQYYPYTKGKSGRKQRKVLHQYDIIMSLQKDSNDEYSIQSNIRWHVGSFKTWKKPDQSQIKSIYNETREKLTRRLGANSKELKKKLAIIRKKGKYLNVGDWNSQVQGLNGDFYWTAGPLCYLHNCSFGVMWNKEPNTNKTMNRIDFPFFGKHELAVLLYLFKKKIIKRT